VVRGRTFSGVSERLEGGRWPSVHATNAATVRVAAPRAPAHTEIDLPLAAGVVEGGDVGMVEAGENAGLAFEALPSLGRRREAWGKDLHGHDPA
jgi:hypothetical protein